MAESKIELPRGCMGLQPKTIKGPCAGGIDIRPGSFDVVIGDVHLSPAGLHVVRPVFIGKVRDEHDVLFLMRNYKVRIAVADTRPETTLAQRLQIAAASHNILVYRAEYNTSPVTIEMHANEDARTLRLDRTMTIDNVHWAFQTGLTVVLPQNYKEITGGEFAREMCNATRVPTRWMGKDCYTWENQGADHSLHAFNYLLAAIKKGNLIAFGGDITMGASRGMVEGIDPRKREPWEDEDGDGLYMEA